MRKAVRHRRLKIKAKPDRTAATLRGVWGCAPVKKAPHRRLKNNAKPERLRFIFEVPSGIEPLYLVLQTSA